MANHEQPGVTVLKVHECWALLRSAEVGRLAVCVDEQPDVFPVNYLVDHGTVVFRTGAGTKLAAMAANPPVAFEVDGYDPDNGAAWSIVIKGRAEQIQGFYEALDALSLPLFPWHPEPKHNFVRVDPVDITGRRFNVVDSAVWRTPVSDKRSAAPE